MILTILAFVTAAALVPKIWKFIFDFLNGPVRNLLEKIFCAEQCKWYVDFLIWVDGKMTAAHRVIKMQWKKFKETVIKVKSIYGKRDDGTYKKTTETIVRSSPDSARRIVVEETVGWEHLPDSVRAEMIRQRTKEAELDVKAVVEEKIRQRADEEGIELVD